MRALVAFIIALWLFVGGVMVMQSPMRPGDVPDDYE